MDLKLFVAMVVEAMTMNNMFKGFVIAIIASQPAAF
jgi:hypothetical protein